jgi:hypothetical protein
VTSPRVVTDARNDVLQLLSGHTLPGLDYFNKQAKCYGKPSHVLPFHTVGLRDFDKILTTCLPPRQNNPVAAVTAFSWLFHYFPVS